MNAVLLVVVELIIGREQKSKKPNMVDKIVQETLEKRPLATHITVQVHTKRFTISYKKGYFNTLKVRCNYHCFGLKFQLIVNMKHGETGTLAQNHAMVENRPDREESKLLLRLGEQNAVGIVRKHNLAIPKNVRVCMHLSYSLKILW